MRVIDYYFYLFFNLHKRIFGAKWMHVKVNVLHDVVFYILVAHVGLFTLCIHEAGVPLGIWMPIIFLIAGLSLNFYCNRFLSEKYHETFLPIESEPKKKRRIKLLFTALLFPLHLVIYLNMHLIAS
jgi:hypothetical protein